MPRAADSDSYVQSNNILEPGQDLELEHMNTIYTLVSDNTPTARPICPPVDYAPQLLFVDAFGLPYSVPQYIYPPPVAAYDHRPIPYPEPMAAMPEQIVASYTLSDGITRAAWSEYCTHTDSLTIEPSQTILQGVGQDNAPHTFARDVPEPDCPVDHRTLYGIPHTIQRVPSYQDSTWPRPHIEPPTSFLSTTDSFRDESTPYIPGHAADRGDELQRLTEAVTAVVEQPSFVCDDCGKDWKTKSGLSHHRVTHNKSKAHRYKCDKCGAGFRYPKDLKRHRNAIHGEERYYCADCHKTYRRKDHLTRHLLCQGHTALSEGTSVYSTSTMTVDRQDLSSQTSLGMHQATHPQPARNFSNRSAQSLNDQDAGRAAFDARAWPSQPAYLDVPRQPLGFVVGDSLDGSFTGSEVDSFADETFPFK